MEVWLVWHFNHNIHGKRDPSVHCIGGFMGPGLYMVTKKYPTSFYHKSKTGDPGHSQSLYQWSSLQVIQKTYFCIRLSCTQEWFHAVVKYFYLPSNVVDVFKTGNQSSLANFLISKMTLRSRTTQNGPCCCPLLAHCIRVIVSAVQTAVAT